MSGESHARLHAVALALLLGGCAAAPEVPPVVHYDLPASTVLPGSACAPAGPVAVHVLESDKLRRDRALLHADDEAGLALEQHHYAYWSDAPVRLLQRRLAEYLRGCRDAPMVLTDAEGMAAAEWHLRGTLLAFEQIRGAGASHVRVALELRFVRRDEALPALLRRYEAEVPVAAAVDAPRLGAAVDAFGAAVDRLGTALLADLGALLAGGVPAP